MAKARFGVYLITDRAIVNGNIVKAVEEALKGGVKAVQLREKDLHAKELLALAKELRSITKRYGAKLIINDRCDVAALVEADGVHLGIRSISPKDAREILGTDKLIGVSTHSVEEAVRAEAEGADFITFGPVFYTPSKAAYGEPVGIELLKNACKQVKIPVYAIGGIKKENTAEVISKGASGIAVISAILGAKDIRKSAGELDAELGNIKGCL